MFTHTDKLLLFAAYANCRYVQVLFEFIEKQNAI